jgi:hypothetical protein
MLLIKWKPTPTHNVLPTNSTEQSFMGKGIHDVTYLRVYKPHVFDKNLPSKIGLRQMHGMKKSLDPPRKSRYHADDWAHDAGIICCETPSRDH